jgi:hypothetical protein
MQLLQKKKYLLSVNTDFEILNKYKKLEKTKLSSNEKQLIKLIKSQLEDNWRKPSLQTLNKLIKKHNL